MIRFTNAVDIDRPADEVFAYLADLEHTPDWNWAIASSEKLTPGPIEVGTRYRFRRSVPRPGTEEMAIVGLAQPERIDVAGRLGPFEARLSYLLTAMETGTRVTNVVELESALPLGPVAELLGGRVRRSVGDNLGVLKRRLEGDA